ncbi:hypothetical protein NOCA280104 [metagenome]|uniref:Uncharacterized protein n=1 Tax=metagenome TaxID=256318 RepID=A0A2P2CFE4_9ZZZZ
MKRSNPAVEETGWHILAEKLSKGG